MKKSEEHNNLVINPNSENYYIRKLREIKESEIYILNIHATHLLQAERYITY